MRNTAVRHRHILEQLKLNGIVKVSDLSSELNVSEVTIRKDLKVLESQKLLKRGHGSATSVVSLIGEKHIDIKEKLQIEEKTLIAKAATKLLNPNDKIIIASGTTLLAFAKEINTKENLTIITSAVKVSLALSHNSNIDIIQLGGTIRKNSVSVIGHYAENILKTLSCDKLFIGVDGIDDEQISTSNMNEAHINKIMIEAAQEVIVLTDSTKFARRGFCSICDIKKIHHIITDKGAPSHIIEKIREQNIKVTLV